MSDTTCPYCGEPIEEINWKATVVRSNISEDGIIGGATFDTFISVPPGTFTALPCGHQVDAEFAQKFAVAVRARKEANDDSR